MTIDRDALVEKGLAAAIDKPSATTPGMVQFGSDMPDDVEDLRAIIANALDAILPEVQAQIEDGLFKAIIAQMERAEKRFPDERHPLTLEPNPKSDEFIRGYCEGRYKVQHIWGVLKDHRPYRKVASE